MTKLSFSRAKDALTKSISELETQIAIANEKTALGEASAEVIANLAKANTALVDARKTLEKLRVCENTAKKG